MTSEKAAVGNWHKCLTEEAWLRATYGRKVAGYRTVKVTEITLSESQAKNSRHDATGYFGDLVEKYEAAMRDGSSFPAVILSRGVKGYAILGGVNRVAAAGKAGLAEVYALVLEGLGDGEEVCVRVALNEMNGRRQSQESVIAHAAEIVLSQDVAAKTIARYLRVSHGAVSRAVAIRKVQKDLETRGVSIAGFSGELVYAMRHAAPASVRDAIARVVQRSPKMSAGDVTRLVEKAKSAGSEADALAMLEAERAAAGRPKPVTASPPELLLKYVREARKKAADVPGLECMERADREKLVEEWSALSAAMVQIMAGPARAAS